MTGKVVSMRGGNASYGDPNPEAVEMLEDLLQKAKSGYLRGIAFATVCEGNARERGWTCDNEQDEILAFHLSRVVHRLNVEMDSMDG